MSKYRIVPKRDFGQHGYLIKGKMVKTGFIVALDSGTYKGCNAMPGACWFQTVAEAMEAIEVLIQTGDTPEFWPAYYKKIGLAA